MSDEAKGGAPKKLSTKDILAAARAQAAKGGAQAPPAEAPEAPAEPTEAAAPAHATEKPAAKPAAAKPAPVKPTPGKKPTSTADILAAARAQAKGGAAAAPQEAAEAPQAAPASKPAAAKPAAAKPAAGGKPKSTADILAAARAAAGKGPAPAESAASEKPAAKEKPAAPAKAPAAAAASEGPKLSVQEMLAAVRPHAPAEAVAKAPAKPEKPAVAPPMPAKPQPAAARKPVAPVAPPPDTQRRNVLLAFLAGLVLGPLQLIATPFAAAWTFLAVTTGIATLATARFMLPNVLTEPPRKFKIGPPADFDLGTVSTKLVAQYGIWVVHTDQYKGKNVIYALISVCTHLGCTPSWLEGEQKFKCPCHGSGFYITGINFEGPAPRPLERAGIRLAEDGMLEVDKSVKFQEEMGQWADPASFFEVVS